MRVLGREGCRMATRGRKPTPTAIKELEGNPGKRPLNTKEPKPVKKAPSCPSGWNRKPKKEWRRLAKQMEQIGILTEVDMAAFAGYCQAYARVERGGGIHHSAWIHRKDTVRLLAAGAAGFYCADLSEDHEPVCRAVWPDPILPEPDHCRG